MSLPCHLVHDCALTEDVRLIFGPHLNASLHRFARVLCLGSWRVAVYGWILLCSPRNVAEVVGAKSIGHVTRLTDMREYAPLRPVSP